jgi:hypothetical protein
MDVFISWSGTRSFAMAEFLRSWIQVVLQATKPWFSDEIQRGATWGTEISKSLERSPVGILCITPENKEQPWLLYEAGALAKGSDKNRVIPLLLDMDKADLAPPLGHFNAALCNDVGIKEVITTLNACLVEPLPLSVVEASLAAHMPTFRHEMDKIKEMAKPARTTKVRPDSDKIDQLLAMMQSIMGRVDSIEKSQIVAASDFMKRLEKESMRNRLIGLTKTNRSDHGIAGMTSEEYIFQMQNFLKDKKESDSKG